MQRFTRDLWRALTPSLMPDPRRPGWSERYLLEACEASVARLAADPRSRADGVADALRGRALADARPGPAARRRTSSSGTSRGRAPTSRPSGAPQGVDGATPRCAALNRKGKPCGREPIWGTPFCVSHTGPPRAAEAARAPPPGGG